MLQGVAITGMQAFLQAGHEIGRAGAEVRDRVTFHEIPKHVEIGIFGTAVIKHDGDAGKEQAGDEKENDDSSAHC